METAEFKMESDSQDKSKITGHYTEYRIHQIQSLKDTGPGKAALANLRRGAGKAPGELPEVWALFLEELPEYLMGKGEESSPAEEAIYDALTLYAVHQQGNDLESQFCHEKGVTLGTAAARLVDLNDESSQTRILDRLKAASVTQSPRTLAVQLRSIIQLMKKKPVALDYAQLTRDLYAYHWPENRKGIRLKWGQDFYKELDERRKPKEEDAPSQVSEQVA